MILIRQTNLFLYREVNKEHVRTSFLVQRFYPCFCCLPASPISFPSCSESPHCDAGTSKGWWVKSKLPRKPWYVSNHKTHWVERWTELSYPACQVQHNWWIMESRMKTSEWQWNMTRKLKSMPLQAKTTINSTFPNHQKKTIMMSHRIVGFYI